jgi:hypothetical protein
MIDMTHNPCQALDDIVASPGSGTSPSRRDDAGRAGGIFPQAGNSDVTL